MNKIKILIADDHFLVRDAIKTLLKTVKDFVIVGEAETGEEAINRIIELAPDIVIMDISMPGLNGIEATRIISQKFPSTKVLVLTIHENKEYIFQILKEGASGCLIKNTTRLELVNAIRTILKGDFYYSKKVKKNNVQYSICLTIQW